MTASAWHQQSLRAADRDEHSHDASQPLWRGTENDPDCEEKSMNTTPAAQPMGDAETNQLCINTIRTLSMDAVQQGQVWPSRHADGARSTGLYPLESRHAF